MEFVELVLLRACSIRIAIMQNIFGRIVFEELLSDEFPLNFIKKCILFYHPIILFN